MEIFVDGFCRKAGLMTMFRSVEIQAPITRGTIVSGALAVVSAYPLLLYGGLDGAIWGLLLTQSTLCLWLIAEAWVERGAIRSRFVR